MAVNRESFTVSNSIEQIRLQKTTSDYIRIKADPMCHKEITPIWR